MEARAEDAPPESLESLPLEAVTVALEWVGPRSVKRFGATCSTYQALARWHVTRREYGLQLARCARLRLKNLLAFRHASCCETSSGDFDARAGSHAARVASALASSGGEPLTKLEILRFLYPMALAARGGWAFAPYALEWCALAERQALTGDAEAPPRSELLALLHEDALARLEAIASAASWPLGVVVAGVAAAACRAPIDETRHLIAPFLQDLFDKAKADAALPDNREREVWFAAAEAAADRCLAGGARLFGSWEHMREGSRAAPAVAQWHDLAGLRGSARSPRAWLAEFGCSPRGQRPPAAASDVGGAPADLIGPAAESDSEGPAEDGDPPGAEPPPVAE